MALVLPYPGQPALNSALQSAPVLGNINAITQAIQSFDASQVAAGTLTANAFATSINPNTILHDTIQPFVKSGCTWSSVSGLIGTMASGIIYIGTSSSFYRVTVNSVGSQTFTASRDTYIDIDYNGNIYYQAVANGAAAPSLTANALRVAKVVTGASTIGSITQTGWDSLGNPIYNVSPNPIAIGYAEITTSFTSPTAGAYTDVTNLSIPVIVPAGRRVELSVGGRYMSTSAAAGTNVELVCTDVTAGSIIGGILENNYTPSGAMNPDFTLSHTPAAGPRTYKVQFQTNASGTFTLACSTTEKAFILAKVV